MYIVCWYFGRFVLIDVAAPFSTHYITIVATIIGATAWHAQTEVDPKESYLCSS
jgi:hypothetical protein